MTLVRQPLGHSLSAMGKLDHFKQAIPRSTRENSPEINIVTPNWGGGYQDISCSDDILNLDAGTHHVKSLVHHPQHPRLFVQGDIKLH
jgi:hypothetical protein